MIMVWWLLYSFIYGLQSGDIRTIFIQTAEVNNSPPFPLCRDALLAVRPHSLFSDKWVSLLWWRQDMNTGDDLVGALNAVIFCAMWNRPP